MVGLLGGGHFELRRFSPQDSILFKNYYAFICVCICACMYHSVCVKSEDKLCGSQFLPSAIWVPGIEPRCSGLAASTCTH